MYLDKVALAIPRSCPKWWNEIRLDASSAINLSAA
jgi:hypothetical protein